MRVISRKPLNEFARLYRDSQPALSAWWKLMKVKSYESPNALKKDFPSASFIGGETTVFNIGGNKYRLVVNIVYSMRTVFVEGVYTHVEYDRLTKAGLLGFSRK
ncbi:MAG TPA: type II toxin-antitoxin system HigB family toxin [Gemmatimonadaceae bacterium]|jgi:mRNA interferase HigB|nr:type II toxin-antitoxin system HigB family toxin [Gemmatimonadaceae bacterium]